MPHDGGPLQLQRLQNTLQVLGEDLDGVPLLRLIRSPVPAQVDLVEVEVGGQGVNNRPP